MSDSKKPKEEDDHQKTQLISGLPEELKEKEQAEMSGSGPRLVVAQGGDLDSKYDIAEGVTAVGRHPSSDIFLDDVTVSRQHAEITRTADVVKIVDMGSLNGTYINKIRSDSAELTSDDEVQIGKFKFLYQ